MRSTVALGAAVSIAALVGASVFTQAVGQAQGPSTSFRTPTGNIGCLVSDGMAACEIYNYSYSAPVKPADCYGAWGDRITVESGGTQFHCHGDRMVEATAPVLDYGSRASIGQFSCLSTVDYVECAGPGHSFRVARTFYTTS
ncbi:DUF6636 domain-containing protein [Nocardia sp. NPDC051030]|uniref:DUF6636 domain-containing protein n=1 Tax=Nocardia sp. NPDC051030 TaxID=3155162 RepID=UPI00341D35C5